MAEEELVSGDGWISDDSSFYGGEDEQERMLALCEDYDPADLWSFHHRSLNALLKDLWSPSAGSIKTTPTALPSSSPGLDRAVMQARPFTASNATSGILGQDRKAMEEERLERLGKKKPTQNPALGLHNIHEGEPNAWQLGESVEDFVRRIPPVSTPGWDYAWIWCANPHPDGQVTSGPSRHDILQTRGLGLLQQSVKERQNIQSQNSQKAKGYVSKLLNQEAESLKQRLGQLAVETNVLTGKWMLFPKLEDLTRTWRAVVDGTSSGRLGCDSKVATDDGKPVDRLICVYTKDFRDADDVLRVLQELVSMGLVGDGKGIYYKSDVYTLLDIYGANAADYGLQASIYSSQKVLASSSLTKANATPQRKQSTLDGFGKSKD
ncbi:hypothetical protein BDV96DRAFT_670716 [Lophiotrema nucula]|uniref:DUF1917-domain-containing protein n=1 Tax=Lophiotrema nucula TaxID=690887 RepID=A0A6A5YP37_9PLEO|nr:hypothetical protein BDV96DRAFT_670716 [Lophiotrema nucula]